MSEKVVLPKFDHPVGDACTRDQGRGDRRRLCWCSLLILGGAI